MLLATTNHMVSSMTTDGATIFWTDASTPGVDFTQDDGRVAAVPLAGGAVTILADLQSVPVDIVLVGDQVYWANQGGFNNTRPTHTGGVWRAPKTGGPAQSIVSGQTAVRAFTADAAHAVYVLSNDPESSSWALLSLALIRLAHGVGCPALRARPAPRPPSCSRGRYAASDSDSSDRGPGPQGVVTRTSSNVALARSVPTAIPPFAKSASVVATTATPSTYAVSVVPSTSRPSVYQVPAENGVRVRLVTMLVDASAMRLPIPAAPVGSSLSAPDCTPVHLFV